jgi:hypothetical protein
MRRRIESVGHGNRGTLMPSSVAELSVAELEAIPDLPSGITRDLAITRIQEGLGFRTDRDCDYCE